MTDRYMSPTRSDEWMMGYALGKAQGRNNEKERIIKLLENHINEFGKDSWLDALTLIEGDKK